MRRYTALKPSRGTVIPEKVRAAVKARDGICVFTRLGIAHDCSPYAVELDHVRQGGMAMKSDSTLDNLVLVCNVAHRLKTENGRVYRPLLLDYLASFEEAA